MRIPKLSRCLLFATILGLIGCGGQQAKELSEQAYSANIKALEFAEAMKTADAAQEQALLAAWQNQAREAALTAAYKKQIEDQRDLVIARINRDYHESLSEARRQLGLALVGASKKIATVLQPIADRVDELGATADEFRKAAEAFPADTVRQMVYQKAAATWFDGMRKYHALRAEHLELAVTEMHQPMDDFSRALAAIKASHIAGVKNTAGIYVSQLDTLPLRSEAPDIASLQPAYTQLIKYLELTREANNSMASYHKMIGFGAGSAFDNSLKAFGRGAVGGLFTRTSELPTTADFKRQSKLEGQHIVDAAKAQLNAAETTATAAMNTTRDTFVNTAVTQLFDVVIGKIGN